MKNAVLENKLKEINYYLENPKQFRRVYEVINLMPNFNVTEAEQHNIIDNYYESENNFLQRMGVSIRVRKYKNKKKQVASLRYSDDVNLDYSGMYATREFEIEMLYGQEFHTATSVLKFFEDKLNAIYSTKLNVNIFRQLENVKTFLTIKTDRQSYDVINNKQFRAVINFDKVSYVNHKTKAVEADNILQIKSICEQTKETLASLNKFVNELEKRCILIPMHDSGQKLENALLLTKFRKKLKEDVKTKKS